MAQSIVIGGLLKKRAELLGSIEQAEDRLAALKESLRALDASIFLFNPELDLEVKARIPRPHQAKSGTVSRLVLAFIRDAPEPVTLAQITEFVMRKRGLAYADKRLRAMQAKRIGAQLRKYRQRGTLTAQGAIGKTMHWRLSRSL